MLDGDTMTVDEFVNMICSMEEPKIEDFHNKNK